MRHLEHFGPQVDLAFLVLCSRVATGLVVQVAAEEVAEPAVLEPEDDRVAVDGVRRGVTVALEWVFGERFVADSRALGRIAEELAGRAFRRPRLRERAKNFDVDVPVVEENEKAASSPNS